MRYLCLTFLVFTTLLSAKEKGYYLSVGAIFRDEAPYLKEWIEFHRLVGVEHFYLYNNNSTDNYMQVLRPYVENGIVELKDWPSPLMDRFVIYQREAYNDCIQKCVGKTVWLAIIDIDEFIVPVKEDTLIPLLSRLEKKKYLGSLKINWQLYGTSFLPSLPSDKLMVESLVWKAPWDYDSKDTPSNLEYKSIIRPEAIAYYRLHEGDFKNNFYAYPKGHVHIRQPVQIEDVRINHYWTRSEDFFYDVKIGRRTLHRKNYRGIMMQKLIDLNQVEDRVMDRFVPALRKIVFEELSP